MKIEALEVGLGFGKKITGISENDIKLQSVRDDLRQCWINDGLVVFRDCNVTPDFQIALSEIFGKLEVHPVKELRSTESDYLITLVSDQNKEGLFEVDGVDCVAFLPWHSDLIFVDRINHGGVLTAKQISSWGG